MGKIVIEREADIGDTEVVAGVKSLETGRGDCKTVVIFSVAMITVVNVLTVGDNGGVDGIIPVVRKSELVVTNRVVPECENTLQQCNK